MANEITTTQQTGIAVLKRMLDADSIQRQFQNALKENKDTFIASIIDLYTSDAQLQTCDPKQVVCEALKAATLHLPVNKALGFSYIVVYNNNVKLPDGSWQKVPTPTFMVGYKGFIQLAMRTGQYETINADIVYDGELRVTDKLTGEIDLKGEKRSDKVIGYFCHFRLLNGFAKTLYMSVHDMASYAKRYSPSVKKDTTIADLEKLAQSQTVSKKVGWEGNFNDMALKTVIRRLLSKYGYLSVEMQTALVDDQSADSDRDTMISENANRKVILTDEAHYEVVDPQKQAQTGKIADEQPKTEEEPY